MKSNESTYNFFVILLITFCIQFTDLKIGFIKVSELALLILLPVLLVSKINKYLLYILLFFSITLIISLLKTTLLEFQYPGQSILKRPYIISIARYVELLTCVVLSVITYNFFKRKHNQNKFNKMITLLVNVNLIIIGGFVLVWIITRLNLINIYDTRFVYSSYRLRGFYVEGGPFGLMLAFLFILTKFTPKNKARFFKRLFLILVITFCAQSKAGLLCVVFWIGIENMEYLKRKIKEFLYPFIIIFAIVFYFVFTKVAVMYINEFNVVETSVKMRPNDPNLVLGRMPGIFISPKIILYNPLFGVGYGNYALVRNNDAYRGFFPLPKKEFRDVDGHSLGGIVDILVDTGILGFAFFIGILCLMWQKFEKANNEKWFIVGFILLFMFGVQIYFLYPWVLLGLLLVKLKTQHEISS